MKTILIWDIENISIKYIDIILNNLIYKPDFLYAVSKQPISFSNQNKLNSYNIKHIQSNRIADEFIMDLFKITLETKNNYIIISSDSDFCKFSKIAHDKGKNIQWFIMDNQKKAILMKNNLTYANIKYFIIEPIIKKTLNGTKSIKNNNGVKLTKNVNGKTSKLSLESLEEIYNKKRVISNNIETNIDKKRNEFIIKQIKNIIHNFNSKYIEGSCDCCGYNSIIRKDIFNLCLECEQRFVLNYTDFKNLSHEEKYLLFFKDVEEEIKKTGFIKYTNESLSLDLLKRQIEKQPINLPKKLKFTI